MKHRNTVTQYFALMKDMIETGLDRNGWQWSSHDSYLLDWAITEVEFGS